MKCCVSTDVRTWTNLLTFEPDPDHSPDAETSCFLRYRIGYGTLQPSLGCQRAALLRGISRRENSTYTYWRHAARASRGFKMVLFTEPSEVNALYRVPFQFLERFSVNRVTLKGHSRSSALTLFNRYMTSYQCSVVNVYLLPFKDIIRIIITTTMFMVLSSWQSHCDSSPGSFDECRMAPSGR